MLVTARHGGKGLRGGSSLRSCRSRLLLPLEGPAVGPLGPSQMTEENNLNIKKRAVALAATAGLVGGLFAMAAPAAQAVQIGGCSGIQFLGTVVPAPRG